MTGHPNSAKRLLTLVWVLAVCVGCASPSRTVALPAAETRVEPPQLPTATSRTLLDERFARTWPNDPRGNAWFTGDGYTLFAREPGQFVAIRAPIAEAPGDVTVTGTFHKLGGPPGGGYGLIVRDQAVGAGDGVDQNGQFIVAGVGDRGEVGVWQRAGSYWIDLLPWTGSTRVRPGTATNELKVEVAGNRLHFDVSGARVADVEIGFTTGSIGVFVGGDLNQVQLDRLLVESPPSNVSRAAAAAAPTPRSDIPATRARLTALTARATQDSTVMQDRSWQQEMAATLAAVQQIAGGSGASATTSTAPDAQRLRTLLGGITDDLASILGAFASGVESPQNPVNGPRALDQAAAHLNSAVSQANQVLAEVEVVRRATQATPPAR